MGPTNAAAGKHILHYFDLPGRGEAVRLALTLGAVAFEDKRFTGKEWPQIKPTTPWLTVPVLELPDGSRLAQTHAVLRYVGRISNPRLYPEDPLLGARVDELMDAINDAQVAINSVGKDMGPAEKLAARKVAAEDGILADFLSRIDSFVGAHGSGGHAVGESLTVADLKLFASCSFMISGFFDGVPPTALDTFSNIQRVRKTVASLPSVCSFYDARGSKATAFEAFLRDARTLDV
mmetsp:Transcript_10766/g.31942  ORF Transcript_10766/g.31942 Transcript_10766/m.31942 type:complete len:235 (-) Transcript_10766:205-909(-)